MLRKTLAVVLALMLTLSLAACTGGNATTPATDAPAATAPAESEAPAENTETETPAAGQALNVCVGPQPETIDPQLNSAVDGAIYTKHLFEGLMRSEDDCSGFTYGVAESYTVSEDNLVYTYTLRDNAVWSDGQPVVAADFVYAWQRLVNPETAAPYAGDMGAFIKNGLEISEGTITDLNELGVKAIDEKTLEVTLSGPCAFIDELMAFPAFFPVRQDIIEANGDKWTLSAETCITNGAFKMASWTADAELVMEKSATYWDAQRIVPAQVNFKLINDPNAEASAVRSGEILFGRDFPQEEMDALTAEGLYHKDPSLGTYYVSFQTEKAPFDNPLVRKAFILAIDSTYIADVTMQGSVIAADAFVGAGFKDADGTSDFHAPSKYYDIAAYEANCEAAKAALAEAGYPNGEGFPSVEYILNNSGVHPTIAEALQSMWKTVLNVDVTLATSDWNVFLATRRDGNYQLARNGWLSDYNDALSMLKLFTSDSGNNDGKFKNEEFDAQIATAMSSMDQTVRMPALHAAEDILMQNWVVAPIYYYSEQYLIRPELKGVGHSATGDHLFHTAYIEE